MFGFLRGSRQDEVYRQAYARCCRVQKQIYGWRSLPFVSFESVFLYLTAVDLNWIPEIPTGWPRCCRLRSRDVSSRDADYQVAQFCTSLAILLARTKLDDDVRDDRSLLARLLRFVLRDSFRKMENVFRSADPQFDQVISGYLAQHDLLEQRSRDIPMSEYVEPTASAFGYVFSLLPRWLSSTGHLGRDPGMFEQLGRHLGGAIISFDCAMDWPADQQRGRFNPVRNTLQAKSSLVYCRRELSTMGWLLKQSSRSHYGSGVVRHCFDRVAQLALSTGANLTRGDVTSSTSRQSWSSIRKRAFRRGVCELLECCAGAEACASCGGSTVEVCAGVGEGCGHCLFCADPTCCVGGTPCEQSSVKGASTKDNKSNSARQNVLTSQSSTDAIGQLTTSESPLRPYGSVMLNGREVPARAEYGYIQAGEQVVVVSSDNFGIVVRKCETSEEK